MEERAMTAALSTRHDVTIALPQVDAFARFTERLNEWWPRAYTWSQDTLEEIAIDPRRGGLCHERGPHGFRCDWGRVLEWDPPRRLVLAWQIGPSREPVPDPAGASTVEVRFAPGSHGTQVTLEHRDFERHGEGAGGYHAAMASSRGWPYILARFAEGGP